MTKAIAAERGCCAYDVVVVVISISEKAIVFEFGRDAIEGDR